LSSRRPLFATGFADFACALATIDYGGRRRERNSKTEPGQFLVSRR
jgi:hypothetical protein